METRHFQLGLDHTQVGNRHQSSLRIAHDARNRSFPLLDEELRNDAGQGGVEGGLLKLVAGPRQVSRHGSYTARGRRIGTLHLLYVVL